MDGEWFLPPRPLWRVTWHRLRERPLQYLLLILGIALGVSMFVAIDLASGSAQRAFNISTQAVTGNSTHRVVGGPGGLDQQLYVDIRKVGGELSAPVVEGHVLPEEMGNRPFRLMGIDLFAEPPFRGELWSDLDMAGFTKFLTAPNTVLLSRDAATQYGLTAGDYLTLKAGGTRTVVTIVGLIASTNPAIKQASRDLVLADIATAQELLHMQQKLSYIDLIIKDGSSDEAIKQQLPADVRLEAANADNNTIQQMTEAFNINLTAFSLIAVLVGSFLIYNSVTFNVMQRRKLFGVLRCVGVTRGQIYWLVMTESIIAGLLGSGLGLIFGVFLGKSLIGLVTQTIDDFYFNVNVRNVTLAPESLVKGLVIGIVAAALATLPPALEAMRSTPASTLRRSALETNVAALTRWLWPAGFALAGFGVLMLWWPSRNLVVAFVGQFAILIAMALVTPALTQLLMLRVAPAFDRVLGPLGRMAHRDIVRSLSRTAVAIAALMTAVCVTVGVSMMVNSFRSTVADWLDTLQADILVSTPTLTPNQFIGDLPADVVHRVSHWPGVRDAVTTRYAAIYAPEWDRDVEVMAVTGDISEGKRPYRWIEGSNSTLWSRFTAGQGVIVTEPLVQRQNLNLPPSPITLMTDTGPQTFPVLAVAADYRSDQGSIMMDQATYREHWQDTAVTSIALFLDPQVNSQTVSTQIRDAFAGRGDLVVQSSRDIRDSSLALFDRSFAVTNAVKLVAMIIAFIGVLSALMSIELERSRELGIFRALGMTARQLWTLTFLRTALMGGIAGLLALPAGFILAWILVYIINVRAFGWVLELHFQASYFLQALLVAVGAALLGGIYPAWRLGRVDVATAIREE